jgi:hypothetical protein
MVDYTAYVRRRNSLSERIRKAKEEYEGSLIRRFKGKPKLFYKHVRQQTKVKVNVTQVLKEDGTKTANDKETAEELCKFFKSVFVNETDDQMPDFPRRTGRILDKIETTPEEVKKLLSKLKEDKTPGPDNLHPKFLKECASSLSEPLSILFNRSLSAGVLPRDWKTARVTPIHKKGTRSRVDNYRPVSLTSIVSKTLEKIIRDHLLKHLETSGVMTAAQHGFTRGRSCLTNLLETLEDWTKALDEGFGVDALYLDYKKAFDTVPHRRLLQKLRGYGVDGPVLGWIQNFLTGREIQVSIRDSYSEKATVTSGVPQGSVIGPILFLVYVNDFPDEVQSTVKLFADDSKVYRSIKTTADQETLQEDMNNLMKWSETWLLDFNIAKCRRMHMGSRNTKYKYTVRRGDNEEVLEESTQEKDLGVWVDSSLKSGLQSGKAAEKGMKALRMIRRTFESLNKENFHILYRSFVRPHLEYAVQAWSPYLRKDITTIENIQRRATKMVKGMKNLSYEERLRRLDMTTLETRRLRGDLIETFKMIKGIEKIDKTSFFVPATSYNLRGHQEKLFKPQARTQIRANFFSNRVITPWNNLPEDVIQSTSTNTFKNNLDRHWKRTRYGQPKS